MRPPLPILAARLDGVVISLDAAAEGAGHAHSKDLDDGDAQHDAAGDDHAALDLTHQRVEAAFLDSHGALKCVERITAAQISVREAVESWFAAAALVFPLKIRLLLFAQTFPHLIHERRHLVLHILVVKQRDEQQNSSDGDGDEETDEEEDEEDAETALVLADGAAAAEEPDDHDDGAQDEQSDGEHPHHVGYFL